MRKELVAKLILFAVALVWVMGLLGVGMILFGPFNEAISNYGIPEGGLNTALNIWFWITLVLIGIVVTLGAFRFIGKWEKVEVSE